MDASGTRLVSCVLDPSQVHAGASETPIFLEGRWSPSGELCEIGWTNAKNHNTMLHAVIGADDGNYIYSLRHCTSNGAQPHHSI